MKISQREARRLKKRVEELETAENHRRIYWATDWPGGTKIGELNLANDLRTLGRIEGARMAKHAVVIMLSNDGGCVRLQALPLAGK